MADNKNKAGAARGNRPAENALQATPSSLSKQAHWQGNAAAEDFLGLNEAPPAAITPPPAPAARTLEAAAGDGSWLLGDVEPEAPVATLPVEEPAFDYAEEVEQDLDEEAVHAPSVLDASWSEEPGRKSSRKKPMLLLAAVAVVAAVGVVMLKPGSRGTSSVPESQEVARALPAPQDGDAPAATPTVVQLEQPKPAPRASNQPGNGEGRRPLDRAGHTVAKPVEEITAVEQETISPTEPTASATTGPVAPSSAAASAMTATPTPAATNETIPPAPATVASTFPSPEPVTPPRARFIPTNSGDEAPAIEVASTKKIVVPPAKPTAPIVVTPPEPAKPAALETIAPSTLTQAANHEPNVQGAAHEPIVQSAAREPLVQGSAQEPEVQVATRETDAPSVGPRVRVLAKTTAPLPEATNARPTVDEHRSSVPTPIVPPVAQPEKEVAEDAAATDGTEVTEGLVHPPSVVTRTGTIPPSDVVLPPAPLNGVRAADSQALQTIWTEVTVPLDRVDSKFKVMTPNVGDVRVTLKTKDVFEGRLYAVGENSIWLEGPYGRMGMEWARVATVDKVGASAAGGDGKAGAFALNERVRAATPNGPVYGRVLSTDATTTKIVTDDGLKISAETKVVERVDALPKVVVKKGAPVVQ